MRRQQPTTPRPPPSPHHTARPLIAQRHALNGIHAPAPIIRQQLRVLDPLLRPVLVQARDAVLAVLEIQQFVAQALEDEDAAGVLGDDGLFVLYEKLSGRSSRASGEE